MITKSDIEQNDNDMTILLQFIRGFTSRDTDKEWQAYRRIRVFQEVMVNELCKQCHQELREP
jgi:hypothetical protein